MTIQEKLQIIQKVTGWTQTEIAGKIGVSFVAFNNWWTGKAEPHTRHALTIDELYKEYTGQKLIPDEILSAKKLLIAARGKEYRGIMKIIEDNSDIYNQYLLELTYNSNKIEGSTLSENETADIMFNNRALPNKSLIEQLEVKNHQAALQYLFKWVQTQHRISEELILKLHGILMNGIRDDAGFYRRHGVRITGSNVPTANYIKVPDLMESLITDINAAHKDFLAHVSRIHARFEKIHPFADGNGRIGRLILAAMLLQKNLAPAIIPQEKKQLYYTALQKAQIKEEYSQLEDFICEAVMAGFDILERKS